MSTGVPMLDAALSQLPWVAALYALLDYRLRRVEHAVDRCERAARGNPS